MIKIKGDKMDCIKSGIFGQIVGDALGLPVQFRPREDRDLDPVTDKRGYGAFDMPPGSWSDDSSLILATMYGLIGSLTEEREDNEDLRLNDLIDYEIIMESFSLWLNDGEFTPFGFAYDVGGATMDGIRRWENGYPPLKSGGIDERDNGNGSLMRILPIAFFIYYLSQKYQILL
jgi:ADP-ribosylglycohydrolase